MQVEEEAQLTAEAVMVSEVMEAAATLPEEQAHQEQLILVAVQVLAPA
jgi:hypothetical protein